MRILVIGHSVEDHIHQNNEEIIKPGGIYYSTLGLSKIITEGDEIQLITVLQKSNEYLFSETYNKIMLKQIDWVDEIPKIHLIIHDSEERTECYENITQNLKIDYEVLNGFDGILINMITGFDITLDQLKYIRKNFNGLIYLDVHSLSRGFDKTKTRIFRLIDNFSQWASQLDIIQANQFEIKTLFNLDSKLEIAREVLNCGTKLLIETRAEDGACLYYKSNTEIELMYVPAEKVELNNKVGCGDIFGSVFFYTFLKTKEANKSLITANYAAGQAVAERNLNDLTFNK
jgi:sugar/nucleoside kinase (ribokinase family)